MGHLEIYAAQTYYKAQEAWVATKSVFTKNGKTLTLLEWIELQKFINKVNPEVTAADVYHQAK